MDIQNIVEKALNGEDYQEDVKDFDDEQLKNLNIAIRDAAKAEGQKELEAVTALRKEKQRITDKPEPPKDEPKGEMAQFRQDQLDKAKEKFFNDPQFKMTDEQKALVEAEFQKLDSKRVDAEFIFNDYKKAYAAVMSDELLASRQKVSEFEKQAANFNAGQAGGDAGGGAPDESKYSEAAKDLMKKWQSQGIKDKTLDDAEKLVSRGADWRDRNLSA